MIFTYSSSNFLFHRSFKTVSKTTIHKYKQLKVQCINLWDDSCFSCCFRLLPPSQTILKAKRKKKCSPINQLSSLLRCIVLRNFKKIQISNQGRDFLICFWKFFFESFWNSKFWRLFSHFHFFHPLELTKVYI